ncbi:unnamed protein product, partial [Owenia fusiformis]
MLHKQIFVLFQSMLLQTLVVCVLFRTVIPKSLQRKDTNMGKNNITLAGVSTKRTHLDLSYINMSTISSEALSGLKSLKSLDLQGKNLKILKTGLFSDLVSLQELNLQENEISTIETAAFSGLLSL